MMMSPHKDHGRGTLKIDRRFRGVGRIKRASGTKDPRQLARMLARFSEIAQHEKGRELLRALQRKEITPLALYDRVRSGTLDDLPSAAALGPLHDDWLAWVDQKAGGKHLYSDDHRRNLKKELRRFERARPGLSAQDLPDVLTALRRSMAHTPRSFNYARAAAMAYLRFTVKRSSPLYLAVWGLDPLPAPKQRRVPDITLQDVQRYPREAWEMAVTGMLPKEYWSRDYRPLDEHTLKIGGTKRPGRDRRVPLVETVLGPQVSLMTFRRRVRETGKLTVQGKDFRNVYAWLLEEAGIPRTRRRLYMGHGKRDVTDLYEEREVRAFLANDARALRRTVKRLLGSPVSSRTAASATGPRLTVTD